MHRADARTRFESLESELVEEARRRRQALDQELQEARQYAEALKGHHQAAIDAQVARLTLASLGTRIDELTDAQLRYLESWRQGS